MFCELLPQDTQSDYHRLRDALIDRFGNVYPWTVAWAMFSQLLQLEGESYEQFAARVRAVAPGRTPRWAGSLCLYVRKPISPRVQQSPGSFKAFQVEHHSLEQAVAHVKMFVTYRTMLYGPSRVRQVSSQ